jgi:hypothetical protein
VAGLCHSGRDHCVRAGVQDVRGKASLPPEGRMSPEIGETLALYDDQRICSSCQHTCFLSAICCNCRSLFASRSSRICGRVTALSPPLLGLDCVCACSATRRCPASSAATPCAAARAQTNSCWSGTRTTKFRSRCPAPQPTPSCVAVQAVLDRVEKHIQDTRLA